MPRLTMEDFAPALLVRSALMPDAMPPMLNEVTDAVMRFLDDQEAIKKAYQPEVGYVVMRVEDDAITSGTMDFLVALLNRSGHVCSWDMEPKGTYLPELDGEGNYKSREKSTWFLYFAIPT